MRTNRELILAARKAIENANNPLSLSIFGARQHADISNKKRIDRFKELVGETLDKNGYYFSPAITAYKLSLQSYIAIHADQLQPEEIRALHAASQSLMPDVDAGAANFEVLSAMGVGLKADANWIDLYREQVAHHLLQSNKVDATKKIIDAYTHDLLNGGSRPVISKASPPGDLGRSGVKLGEAARTFLPFFPMNHNQLFNGASCTDEIMLQTGGCLGHSAMVRLWKQGVDQSGNPVTSGALPHHYRFYRTMCNAGLGCSSYASKSGGLYSLGGVSGQAYTVETREILPPAGYTTDPANHHLAMYKTLSNLINAERELLIYRPPIPGPNGEQSDPTTMTKWHELNNSVRMSAVLPDKSVKTMPQKTGNCTVRSILEFLRFELIHHQGLSAEQANKILSSHWEFAAKNDTITTNFALGAAENRASFFPHHFSTANVITAIKKYSGNLLVVTIQDENDSSNSQEVMYDASNKKVLFYDVSTQSFSESSDPKFSALAKIELAKYALPSVDVAEKNWVRLAWKNPATLAEDVGRVSAITALSNGLFIIKGYLFNFGKGREREVIYDAVNQVAWWYDGQFKTIDLTPPAKSMGAAMVEKFSVLAPAYNIKLPSDQDLFADIANKNFKKVCTVIKQRSDVLGCKKESDPFKNTTVLNSLIVQLAMPANDVAQKKDIRDALLDAIDHAPFSVIEAKDGGGNTVLHRSGYSAEYALCDKLMEVALREGKINEMLNSVNAKGETALSNILAGGFDDASRDSLFKKHFSLSSLSVSYLSNNNISVDWQKIAMHEDRQNISLAIEKLIREGRTESSTFQVMIEMTVLQRQEFLTAVAVPAPPPLPSAEPVIPPPPPGPPPPMAHLIFTEQVFYCLEELEPWMQTVQGCLSSPDFPTLASEYVALFKRTDKVPTAADAENLHQSRTRFLSYLISNNGVAGPLKDLFDSYQPSMATTASLDMRIENKKSAIPKSSTLAGSYGVRDFILGERVDALFLPGYRCIRGGVQQMASQANCNESKYPNKRTPPEEYRYDATQGPRAQMTDAILALARFHQIEKCDLLSSWRTLSVNVTYQGNTGSFEMLHAFSDIFEESCGYLHPKLGYEYAALQFIKMHKNLLLTNAELSRPDAAVHYTTQVAAFAFALGRYDYSYDPGSPQIPYDRGANKVYLDEACKELLKIQYEMIAKVTVLQALDHPDERIPLVLSLVGGDVFGNDRAFIGEAILAAKKIIQDSGVTNIDFCISVWTTDECEFSRTLLNAPTQFSASELESRVDLLEEFTHAKRMDDIIQLVKENRIFTALDALKNEQFNINYVSLFHSPPTTLLFSALSALKKEPFGESRAALLELIYFIIGRPEFNVLATDPDPAGSKGTAAHLTAWRGEFAVCTRLLDRAKGEGNLDALKEIKNVHGELLVANVTGTAALSDAQKMELSKEYGFPPPPPPPPPLVAPLPVPSPAAAFTVLPMKVQVDIQQLHTWCHGKFANQTFVKFVIDLAVEYGAPINGGPLNLNEHVTSRLVDYVKINAIKDHNLFLAVVERVEQQINPNAFDKNTVHSAMKPYLQSIEDRRNKLDAAIQVFKTAQAASVTSAKTPEKAHANAIEEMIKKFPDLNIWVLPHDPVLKNKIAVACVRVILQEGVGKVSLLTQGMFGGSNNASNEWRAYFSKLLENDTSAQKPSTSITSGALFNEMKKYDVLNANGVVDDAFLDALQSVSTHAHVPTFFEK